MAPLLIEGAIVVNKFTIMHISDLHRAVDYPLTNAEILSALLADRDKIRVDAPPISPPDALIVTGDLVQGMTSGGVYPDTVTEQYQEACDLLIAVANKFFDGDRSRVIILPGNHDVDWTVAKSAMTQVEITGDIQPKIADLLFSAGSDYRWNWRDQSLWKIHNRSQYAKRFAFFQEFAEAFYEHTPLKYPYNSQRDWNLFSLADGAVVVAAFNSCADNDCFSRVGRIPNESIADCFMFMRDNTKPDALRIAAWHHNTEGSPYASDYLDASTIRLLIDRGFGIGLHGHQHRSDAPPPHILFASGQYEMPVFSAGSLCAGSSALPQGYNPQYNFLEIDFAESAATVHVREMIERGIFCQGRLRVLNHASFSKVFLHAAPPARVQGTGTSGGAVLKRFDEVELLRADGRVREALEALLAVQSDDKYARQLHLTMLLDLNDWRGIISAFGSPRTLQEALSLVRAHIETRDAAAAEASLVSAQRDFEVPSAAAANLKQRISALRATIQ